MHKKSAAFLFEPLGSMYLQPYFESGSRCLDPMTSPSYLAKRELVKVSGEVAVKYGVARQGDLPLKVRERYRKGEEKEKDHEREKDNEKEKEKEKERERERERERT